MSKRTSSRAKLTSARAPKFDSSIELIARAVIVERSHVLLCRNVKHGYHFLPGGHVEFSESAPAALERELLEECGMKSATRQLLLVSEHIFNRPAKTASPKGKNAAARATVRPCHEINLVFHVEPTWPISRPSRSRKASQPSHAAQPASLTPLPNVISKEPKIAFDWVDLAALVDLDLRPLSIKAWLMGGGGVASPSTLWQSERAS